MSSILLIAFPLFGAALAFFWRGDRTRPLLLPATGILHTALALWLLVNPPPAAPGAWFGFDPIARAMLPAVSILFLACAAYSVSYLRIRTERSNRVFVASMLAVLGLLSAGHQAMHLGMLWITTEAVTLAAVPLLHFNGTSRAFEATWKYLGETGWRVGCGASRVQILIIVKTVTNVTIMFRRMKPNNERLRIMALLRESSSQAL